MIILIYYRKFSILCSITEGWDDVSYVLDLYCSVFLFSDTDICREYKDCGNPLYVSGGQVLGIDIPDNTLYYAPPGINLDNTWQAEIGVKLREIDISGAVAFNISGGLAIEASRKLLKIAENFMHSRGHVEFWTEVKSYVSSKPKEYEFEKFNHFPFQFLSTGPYPVGTDDEGYYLRITLKTSTDSNSGTDAPIKVIGGGKEFTLDYMPGANPLVGYNDFETGDEIVYTVGPFDTFPTSIQLKNDAPDSSAIFEALGNDIKNFFVGLVESIKDLFLNQADYVGSGSFVMQPSYFDTLSVGTAKLEKIYVNGEAEGKYDIYFNVTKISETSTEFTVEVSFWVLYAVSECTGSLCDAGSADEPFLLSVLSSYPGQSQTYMTEPFDDVDTGEAFLINHSFSQVTFTKPLSAIVLSLQIWESDLESKSEREDALNKMLKDTEDDSSAPSNFFTKIGEAAAADWKLDGIRVYSFNRGERLEAGLVLNDDTDRWIEGGESHTFNLDQSKMKSLGSLNFEPNAICQNVYKETDVLCSVYVDVSDLNGGSTDPECDVLSYSANRSNPFYVGDTTVLLTVTDTAGNTDQCTSTVTVVDNTPPFIFGCNSVVVECSALGGTSKEDIQLKPFFNNVVASDACDNFVSLENTAPDLFLVDVETMVKFTATDDSDNSVSCTSTVTVMDNTPPLIFGCNSVVVECSTIGGTSKEDVQLTKFFNDVLYYDTCDAQLSFENTAPDLFLVDMTTMVKFTATDDSDNSVSCTSTLTVVDSTPPLIFGCNSVVAECSAIGGTPKEDIQLTKFFNDVLYYDTCDVQLNKENTAPDLFLVDMTTMVNFTATDFSNNTGSCVADVTVIDTTKPSITMATSNIKLWPPSRKYVTFDIFKDYGVSSSDACCGDQNTYIITEVSSNEGNESIRVTGPTSFKVLSHRRRTGRGRVYKIAFNVTDCHGQIASSEVYVTVPKSMVKPYWVLVNAARDVDIGIISMNRLFSLNKTGTSLSLRLEAPLNVTNATFYWIENGVAKEKTDIKAPFYMNRNIRTNVLPVPYLASTGNKMVNVSMLGKSSVGIRKSTISFQMVL
jgi:HYR domain